MTAFANLSFETAGATPGQAASWTISAASLRAIADFDTVVEPWEDFEEGWSNDSFVFELTNLNTVKADFATLGPAGVKQVENFEEQWFGNENYVYGISGTAAVFNGDNFEDFETGWANDSYIFSFVGIATDLAYGTFGAAVENFESFELEWDTTYLFEFVGVGSDLTLGLTEDFEASWPAMTTI